MNTQTKNLGQINIEDARKHFEGIGIEAMLQKKPDEQWHEQDLQKAHFEKMQMRDQIEMLEREIDRQSTIIDALIKAIKVIERG